MKLFIWMKVLEVLSPPPQLKYILEYLDIVNEQSCHSSYLPLYSVFLIQYFQYHTDLISIQYF